MTVYDKAPPTLTARFPGRCASCGARHIHVGDAIVQEGHATSTLLCWTRRQQLMGLQHRVEVEMANVHGVALGCWGVAEHLRKTFSRREFYSAALKLGVVTPEQYEMIRRSCATVWDRDLSD